MKYFLLLTLISSAALSKEINFDAFKVDTSISDIKPVKKEVGTEKTSNFTITTDENSFRISSDNKAYRPGSYKPIVNPFIKQNSNFGANHIESMNQSARGINTNM